ncbi:MAG TPA: glycosyltransferase [Candidatus Latescibacteria bacterium]|nr:glycosyltransferase [Candidatus Latescibacterota bacterium]
MIRVLHVINTLAPGGAETLVTSLCQALPREGVEPLVAYLFGDGTLGERLKDHGIGVERLSHGSRPSLFALPRAISLIRSRKIDLVHAHLVYAGIVAKIAARFTGVPVVMTRHWVSDPKQKTFLFRLDDRLTRRYVSTLIAVGEQVRAAILTEKLMPPERVVVLRNAVDVSRFRVKQHEVVEGESFVVGTVGRLEAPKAHGVFLEAIARLRETFPGVRGLIAGDGRLRSQLEETRVRLGLEGVVDFVGAIPAEGIPDFLNSLDVFVLTSNWEGLPMALIEASASGLPVVGTDVGGVGEVVVDEVTGYLVPPGNPSEIASRVACLLKNTELRATLGVNARHRAETEFDVTRLAHDTAGLYRATLGIAPADS